MTTSNTQAAAKVSAQKGSILLLSFVLAIVRACLVIPAAVSLGPAARYFFPEMFAIQTAPMLLLAIVFVDTFAIVFALLMLRAQTVAGKAR